MSYEPINFEDGENKYDIRDQLDNIIEENIKLVYTGTGGTPLSAENLNKMEQGIADASIPPTLPTTVPNYQQVAHWADLLIPDADRGEDLLEFLLDHEDTSEQVSESEQAMYVIMEEEDFDKTRQIPEDYEHALWGLGQFTPVAQIVAWVEELLADYQRGQEKLELGYMTENSSEDLSSNEYAQRVIHEGEEYNGLLDYRVEG